MMLGAKFNIFFKMQNAIVFEIFKAKVESLKFQQFCLMKFEVFQSFDFDLEYFWYYCILKKKIKHQPSAI